MSALRVGDELPPLAAPPISRATLALFSGDHNPIHVDLDVARGAGLDDVFAHGMLSAAYLARMLTDRFPQASIRSYRGRFAAITPVHGEPTCTGRVAAAEDGVATLELAVTLADGTTTLTGDATVALDI